MLIDHHESHTTVTKSTSPLWLCDYATLYNHWHPSQQLHQCLIGYGIVSAIPYPCLLTLRLCFLLFKKIISSSPLRLCDYATHLYHIIDIHRKSRTFIKSYEVLESRCYTIVWPCDTATLLTLKIITVPAPCYSATLRLIHIISLTSIARVVPLLNHNCKVLES